MQNSIHQIFARKPKKEKIMSNFSKFFYKNTSKLLEVNIYFVQYTSLFPRRETL